ncbi:MAG: response regulator [Candidatus Methanomethylophilaceae archaeon]
MFNGISVKSILVVDDEECILELAQLRLGRKDGFTVDVASSAEEAWAKMLDRCYDLVVSDYEMPVTNGADLLRRMRARGDYTPFIIVTSRGKESVALDCQKAGVDAYLQRSGSGADWISVLLAVIEGMSRPCPSMNVMDDESENLFRDLLNDGTDPDIRVKIDDDELLKQVHAEDKEAVKNIIQVVMDDEEPRMAEFRIRSPSGWVWQHGLFLSYREGNGVRVSMKGIDTQRKQLMGQGAQWQMMTRALHDAPLQLEFIDSDYNLLFSNRYPQVGDRCHRVIRGSETPCQECGMKKALEEGKPNTTSFNEDGRRVEITYVPSRDEDGNVNSVLRLQYEYPVPPSSDETLGTVLETNRKLHLLTSIIRHDMLNQLTAMMGYLDLYDEFPEKREMLISRLRELVHNMDRQITFTRSYQKLGSTAPSWQDCEGCVQSAMDELDIDSEMVYVEGPLPLVFGDPMLERVIFNLFSNSLMHGESVSKIRVWFQEDEEKGSLFVADNGRGIPSDKKDRIFDRGFGSNRGYGLFLIRNILDITGITIHEVGEEGSGACFRLDIPSKVYTFKNRRGGE